MQKIALAEAMMFNTEIREEGSATFDAAYSTIKGPFKTGTAGARERVRGLTRLGSKLRNTRPEYLTLEQFQKWTSPILDVMKETVFRRSDDGLPFRNNIGNLLSLLEAHVDLLLKWSLDYPVSVSRTAMNGGTIVVTLMEPCTFSIFE